MLPHEVIRYPRMVFRGESETCVVQSHDELLAKRADGWRATLLPGEAPEDIGETLVPVPGLQDIVQQPDTFDSRLLPSADPTEVRVDEARPGAGPARTVEPPKRGRPPKRVE